MIDSATVARAEYLAWLRTQYPALYERAVKNASDESSSLNGFFDSVGTAFSNVVSSVSNALPQLAQTYSEYQQARALIELNNKRASQGLSPLTYNSNGQLVTASGIPYTQNDLEIAGSGFSTGTLLLAGGAVLLLGFLLLRR